MLSAFFTHLGFALIRVLSWLPLPLLVRVGNGLGAALFVLAAPRRRVALTNLRLCFPDMPEAERVDLAQRHFKVAARSFLERGILWWGSEARIRRLVRMEGADEVRALMAARKPVILLCPHFVELDWAATRLSMEIEGASIYSRQKNPVVDEQLRRGRTRFRPVHLFSRHDGLFAIVRVVKKGAPFFYLPDMDFGPQEAIFTPFFGVPAATITALPRLAKLAGATVVPTIARALPGGEGVVVTFDEPWANFPSADLEADVRRMNAYIESVVRTMPEQYYWVHKRFKTRPAGEPSFYD